MSISSPVNCPQCGQENPGDARFCMRCGTALTQRCPNCGTTNTLGAQFCLRCGIPLGGAGATERRVLSVLFADIVGSTQLVARIDPEPMRVLIAQYFAAMRAEVERHGGVVEKFIGDAVMALFGLPFAHEDDADRAVRAAVAMQRRMADLNASSGVDLHIRVGIATGEVVADPAAVSSGQAMVTGEAVNLAARLQAQAPSDAIVIEERTFRALRLHGEFRPLTGEPGTDFADLPRWQVMMVSEGTAAKRLRAPLVGREDERQFLLALYQRVVESRRQHLITVLGAAGVGKSRLLEEFARTLSANSTAPRVLRGRCPSYREGLTYWPIAEMIKQECNIKDNDAPAVVREKLRAGVERVCGPAMPADERAVVAADLIALLGLDVARPYEAIWRDRLTALKAQVEIRPGAIEHLTVTPVVAADGRRGGEVIIPSMRAFFVSLAERGPLVLIIEDLHWAQESLLDLLERVAVRGPDVPILTICLARPELLERRPDWGARLLSHTTLSLTPLRADVSRTLLNELLNGEPIPADIREAILTRAEGNPFFIEEILRRLIDGGELVRVDHGWKLAAPTLEIRIPDTIHGILASRLDLLTPLEKRVIQHAAVAGRFFWISAVAAMSGLPQPEVTTALDRLGERDLIEARETSSLAGEREFTFKHALIKDVAYSLLPKLARSDRHLRYAQWLERTTGQQLENLLATLAWHYEQAWRNQFDTGEMAHDLAYRAVAALRRAGARATHLRTLPEARHLLERALAVLRNAGLTHDLPVYLELLIEHTEVVKWLRSPAPVIEATDIVLREAQRIDRVDLVARAWLNRAFAQYDWDERDEAEESLHHALELFRSLGDRQGEVETLEELGSVTSDLRGSLREAEDAYRSVIELYREIGDGMGLARTTTWLGRTILQTGRLAEAMPILEEGLQLSREHHERISEASALMGLAIVAHLQGRGDESETLHKEVLKLLRGSGSRLDEAATRRHLAMVLLRHGKLDEAEEQVRKAQALRREHGLKPESSQLLRTLAEITLAEGELLAAADYAERALALVPEIDEVAIATHSTTLAKVRAAQGRGEEMDALFRPALQVLETSEYVIDRGLTLMKYGESLQMLDRHEEACAILARARDVFAQMGAAYFVQLCEERLSAPATAQVSG
jgi:class 3 adenylate cyclase/tetratricopeptide (TPR) repeat protein